MLLYCGLLLYILPKFVSLAIEVELQLIPQSDLHIAYMSANNKSQNIKNAKSIDKTLPIIYNILIIC